MRSVTPRKLAIPQAEDDDVVTDAFPSARGEKDLEEALKKFSNIGSNSRKMNAFETNMIFKT